jgi:hypothetical protein
MRNISLLLALALAGAAGANELPDMPKPKVEADAVVAVKAAKLVEPKSLTNDHKFWDRTNKIEFAVGWTLFAFDAAQTCHNLANGGHEDFNKSQSCAANVAIMAGWQAGMFGVARLLHKTHHHKLERIPEAYLIANSVRGIVYSKQHGAW